MKIKGFRASKKVFFKVMFMLRSVLKLKKVGDFIKVEK